MISENLLIQAFEHSNSHAMMHGGFTAPAGNGNLQEEVGKMTGYAESLYKKYEAHVGDMPKSWTKSVTVMAMENYARATKHMQEGTKTSALASFDKYAMPLYRMVLPELATNKLFSIQMMFGPTSQVFFFDYVHGTTRGGVTAGSKLFENHEKNYGDSQIDLEVLGTGNGSTAAYSSLQASHLPIVPGSLTITAATSAGVDMIVTDDGNGALVGDLAAGSFTVNYATGAINLTFSSNVGNGNAIESQYTVDSEGNENGIPEIDLALTSSPITARNKKLRMRWSMESAFSLRDTLGLDAEVELLAAAGAEIGYGIDSVNIDNVTRVAMDKRLDTAFQFNKTTPSGISFTEYKHEFCDYLIKGSSYILSQSGRAVGNWVVGGEEVCNICESLAPRFKPNTNVPATRGILELGVLDGRWTIFKDTRMNSREYLMGFKGEQFLFAGYVWAPWITAFTTPTTYLDDMQGRKGIGSLYGQKMVNPKMYLRLKIVAS